MKALQNIYLLPLIISVICSPLHAQGKYSKLVKTFDSLLSEVEEKADDEGDSTTGWKKATFGNGCFWCTEAVFEELHGVRKVVSGYTGGNVPNPTYQQVCTGLTGHAEAIQMEYDPSRISYAKLLEVFWRTHDPTTLNRQGPDKGTQYRSAVFFHDKDQQELAKRFKAKLNEARAFGKPVVTEVTKAAKFYPAERYHQDYFTLNGRAPYCRQMIAPKLSKFRRVFADELAKNKKNREKEKELSESK